MKYYQILKTALTGFLNDDCMVSGAALAYYTIFSLPPLLVMIFFLAGAAGVPEERVDAVVSNQLGMPIPLAEDEENASPAQSSPAANERPKQTSSYSVVATLGPVAKFFGVLMLVFSATGVFAQLQAALNRAWEVEPDPEQGGVLNFIMKRVVSLGMIVVIAFLLMVSLVLTSLLDEIVAYFSGERPSDLFLVLGGTLNVLLSTGLATLLFAAVYKILPDVDMQWKHVWVGGLFTAVLFVAGKSAIGLYLENSDLGSSWGSAAASMIAMLVWVYYSSLIVLFGAEVTQAWACEFGEGIRPSKKAVRVVVEKKRLPNEDLTKASGGKHAASKSTGKLPPAL